MGEAAWNALEPICPESFSIYFPIDLWSNLHISSPSLAARGSGLSRGRFYFHGTTDFSFGRDKAAQFAIYVRQIFRSEFFR